MSEAEQPGPEPRPEKPTTIAPLLLALAVFLVVVGAIVVNGWGSADEPAGLPPLPSAVEDFTLTTDPDATSGTYEGPGGSPVFEVSWDPDTSVQEQIESREYEASGEWACMPQDNDGGAVCWVDYRGGAVSVAFGDVVLGVVINFGDQFLFRWR